MIVTSMKGERVSLIEKVNYSLRDTKKRTWTRDATKDTPSKAAYTCSDGSDSIAFTKKQLARVCKGNHAIQELTSLEEVKDFISRLDTEYREVTDTWTDERIQLLLTDAQTANKSTLNTLLSAVVAEYERLEEEREREEYISETRKGISLVQETQGRTNVPPQAKKPRETPSLRFFRIVNSGETVQLTDKQYTVMVAVTKVELQGSGYATAEVVQRVSGELSAVSIGAVISTLREKGLVKVHEVARRKYLNFTKRGQAVLDAIAKEG